MTKSLVVRGARQHNLRDVTVEIPRDRLVVVTGPSGSGKSSLAFDTIYAEGQRRYVESLSAYARQFLDRLPKPDVETIEGLSPAIAIQQQTPSKNPRSTVGTVTEIHDYLRLLYARVGEPHCPRCGKPIRAQTPQQMVDRVLSMGEGTRFSVLAPVVRARKGEHQAELQKLRKEGFVRVRVDGEVRDLGDDIALDKRKVHSIDVVVDRLSVRKDDQGSPKASADRPGGARAEGAAGPRPITQNGSRQRLTESIELSLSMADGLVIVAPADGEEILFSERFACAECGISLPEITPRLFSFNNPAGACPECGGLGEVRQFDPELAIPDPSLSIAEGAVAPWGKPGGVYHRFMLQQLDKSGTAVDLDKPWSKLPKKARERMLNGEPDGWEGILPGLARRMREYERRKREEGASDERAFEYIEEEIGRFARRDRCTSCDGARLRPEALAITVQGEHIGRVTARSVHDALAFFGSLELSDRDRTVADRLVREITSRLGFLVDVGLDYLSLDRASATLSGGESERIRLATQIGSALVGVLYVLDEPSIGLHPRDNARLIETLLALRDRGNTVIVVEHDADTIRAADHVVDMGPGAGKAGGRVVSSGAPEEVASDEASLTGAFLSGRRRIEVPKVRRDAERGALVLRGVRTHNLKGVDVSIPLGRLVAVTGVSGSGKSSLIVDTLLPAARAELLGRRGEGSVEVGGVEGIDKIIDIDQSPIGRTPRSNPATYTGVLTFVRDVFSSLPEARARGYKPARFSFNVKGGRCETCQGDGVMRIEMHFLPDVYVECEECGGKRYNRETLEIRYRGLSIADVLGSTVDEAAELFAALPKIRDRLETLRAVGLGYLELGQSATTLSGGEAQRIKLARELSKRSTGRTLYVLDEPTTGLHFSDVEVLVGVLDRLVEAGNTVVVIEHDLDVIKVADWVIDLGPEGGDAGGRLVVTGTPEDVAACEESHTGRYLRPVLGASIRDP